MAKLLKMNLCGEEDDLELAFAGVEPLPVAPANPLWERFRDDPRWLIDLWLVREGEPQIKRAQRRGGSH
jgi:hypothetical protein